MHLHKLIIDHLKNLEVAYSFKQVIISCCVVLHQVCSRQVCNILKKSSFTKCVQQTHSCVAFAHSDKYHIFGVVSLSSIEESCFLHMSNRRPALTTHVCRLKQNGNSLLWLHMFTYIVYQTCSHARKQAFLR